jgi:hypothetical protein
VSIAIDGSPVASGKTLDSSGAATVRVYALLSPGTHTATVTSSTGQTATTTFTM